MQDGKTTDLRNDIGLIVLKIGRARFNVPLGTVYVISETMFYRSDDPTNSAKALKEGGQIALNLTRLMSPCYNNTTCMHIQDNDTQRNLSE